MFILYFGSDHFAKFIATYCFISFCSIPASLFFSKKITLALSCISYQGNITVWAAIVVSAFFVIRSDKFDRLPVSTYWSYLRLRLRQRPFRASRSPHSVGWSLSSDESQCTDHCKRLSSSSTSHTPLHLLSDYYDHHAALSLPDLTSVYTLNHADWHSSETLHYWKEI